MSEFSFAVALLIAVGIVGVLVPFLPGALLVLAAVVAWGLVVGGTGAWVTVTLAVLCLAGTQLLKYVIPGRNLRGVGVPRSTLAAGAVTGVVGFFVVPVVGLPLGFLAAVYVVERGHLGSHSRAVASTLGAVRAVGLSVLIEMSGALLAAAIWGVGAFVVT